MAATGCSLLSVTVMWTGASGANERKGLMQRCGRAFVSMELLKPLHFLSWTPTHTYITYKMARTCSGTNVLEFCHCNQYNLLHVHRTRKAWMHTLVVNKCMCKCTDTLCYVVKNIPIDTHTLGCSKQCYKMDLHAHINHQSSTCKWRCRIMVQFTLVLLHIETFHTKSVSSLITLGMLSVLHRRWLIIVLITKPQQCDIIHCGVFIYQHLHLYLCVCSDGMEWSTFAQILYSK